MLNLSTLSVLSLTFLILAGPKLNADELCDDGTNECIEVMIAREARKQGVDPRIAIAVAKVESSLNPRAKGSKGEIGLFQIMPYHSKSIYSLNGNISYGVKLLKEFQQKCSDMGKGWVVCYNNGQNRRPKHPLLHPYYRKVMAAMR